MNMKTRIINTFWQSAMLLLAGLAAAAGCTKHNVAVPPPAIGPGKEPSTASVRLILPASAAGMEDTAVNDLSAFRFKDGRLAEVLSPAPAGTDGLYALRFSENTGELYLLANSSKIDGLTGSLVPGESTVADLLGLKAAAYRMTSGGSVMMTGKLSLGQDSGPEHQVRMVRSLARVDIRSLDKDVSVMSVSISGLAEEGHLFPSSGESSGEAGSPAGTYGFVKDYSAEPLSNSSDVLLYVVEQQGGNVPVEIVISESGGLVRLRTELPQKIERNTVYTIDVNGKGAEITVSSSGSDWESGTPGNTEPVLKGMVDASGSLLPAGVSVNASGDEVTVLPEVCEFELVLLGVAGNSLSVNGRAEGVEVNVLPRLKSGLTEVAGVGVRCDRTGMATSERIYLDYTDGNANTGRVTLVFGS